MSILPPTKYNLLQAVIIIICAALAYFIYLVLMGGTIWGILFTLLFVLPIGIGLWFLKEFARMFVTFFIMMSVFILPVGIINPFTAMDMQNPPDIWPLILYVYPWVILGVFLVHILGKYKSEFTHLIKT